MMKEWLKKMYHAHLRPVLKSFWKFLKKVVPKNRYTWTVYDKIRNFYWAKIQKGGPADPMAAAPATAPVVRDYHIEEKPALEEIWRIHKEIPTDSMGGSPLDKCYLMVYLARRFSLKTFVEIGVYRGKSLFSVAPAFLKNGGKCYGIDPWKADALREKELSDELKKSVDDFADTADFDGIYNEVVRRCQQFEMEDSVVLLRQTAENAYEYFREAFSSDETGTTDADGEKIAFIDMLHIDGNHDYEFVRKDAQLYIPHVRKGGIIVFDDVGWSGVRRVYDSFKKYFVVLYEDSDFAVLYRDEKLAEEMQTQPYPQPSWAQIRLMRTGLPALMENVRYAEAYRKEKRRPKVFAAIMTYNSAAYIEQCIRSIFAQEGEFDVEIGVFDDASTDDTVERVRKLLTEIPPHIGLTIHPNAVNGGYEKNYIRVFNALKENGADFLTCIDGDDYLIAPHRFQKHVDMLLQHPECALCFNRLKFYFQKEDKLQPWAEQDSLTHSIYTAADLAKMYFIGNGSCSTIRRNAACSLPMELYTEVKAGDWLTHLMYATKGDIGYLSEPMNVYRKHSKGAWSGISLARQYEIMFHSVEKFNQLTSYLFYSWLFEYQAKCFAPSSGADEKLWDITIVDDVFPHPVSGFRMAEYGAYLRYFENLRILCNGSSSACLGTRAFPDIIASYKQEYPEFAPRLIETYHPYKLAIERILHSRLAYFCFLGNAYFSIDIIERNRIPFVLELYPGGSFFLNDPQSDAMLKRVMLSPYFRKVIVTQDITKKYLLEKHFCIPEKIVEIFGIVTQEKVLKTTPKLPAGGNGSLLKVCFAAMRYTPTGDDKGYDVFLDAARSLVEQYENIEFHVAGTFDETVLPLDGLEYRVTFHGVLDNTALSEFFQDMDIIVSPNLNGRIQPGAFDGFPTGTCTEAGLNGVLIICTDPLHLNGMRFKNGYEIEIVEHSASAIAELIEYYYHHRDVLREAIQHQGEKIRELYSTHIQIGSRIRVLEEELNL